MPKDGSKLWPDGRLYEKCTVKSLPFMQFSPASSKDNSPCEKWDHCDFLGWVHLVLRLKEGSSAALWKGSEIRPCNKQFISNSAIPYTQLYFTITAAASKCWRNSQTNLVPKFTLLLSLH
jgi:hypothetical protein